MDNINTISLPSFLRRTMRAYVLKKQIRSLGCELHRIGRSRNWQLKANFEQLTEIIAYIEINKEPSWHWLTKLLTSQYQHFSYEALLSLAQRTPNITVTQLMIKTDCTIIQARKVIDEIEWKN